MYTVLTIAGSDSSGGAGIQADIKTMCAHGIYATSAITAITAQNTTGVKGIFETTPEFLEKQLDAIFADIFPDAVKIGMLANKQLIQVVAQKLKFYKAKNIVLDPVMVSTSGSKLIKDDAIEKMINLLFPLASVITPNIPETQVLTGIEINNEKDMETAGIKLSRQIHTAVLVKGGHSVNNANDMLITENKTIIFPGERINNPNTHGTGCTLSSAIACNLAKGFNLETSIKNAKQYLTNTLKDGLNLGKGSGPVNHLYKITGEI